MVAFVPATLTSASISATAEEHEVAAAMRAQGLSPYCWSNGPHDTYAVHSHTYHKVLYCVRGSIRFELTDEHQSLALQAGDRLDLEPRTRHSAVVGPDGVVCLEAQR
jgi:hypothetical protein